MVVLISFTLSGCFRSIDSLSRDISKSQQNLKENTSYTFAISPSYATNAERPSINDLGRYFSLYEQNGKYIRITPKFNSHELIIELLDTNKQKLNEKKFPLQPYSKEFIDKSKFGYKKFYFTTNKEIIKKSTHCVADLGQSCSFHTTQIFLDKDENLVITDKSTDIGLIFLIPVSGKSSYLHIFDRIE